MLLDPAHQLAVGMRILRKSTNVYAEDSTDVRNLSACGAEARGPAGFRDYQRCGGRHQEVITTTLCSKS